MRCKPWSWWFHITIYKVWDTYTYGLNNRLLTDRNANVTTCDTNGNQLSRTDASGKVTSYSINYQLKIAHKKRQAYACLFS